MQKKKNQTGRGLEPYTSKPASTTAILREISSHRVPTTWNTFVFQYQVSYSESVLVSNFNFQEVVLFRLVSWFGGFVLWLVRRNVTMTFT